jgi:natural product precursor
MKKKKICLRGLADILSEKELKNVLGGSSVTCLCQCYGIGTWTGTYSSVTDMYNAIIEFCRDGGTCNC